MTGCGGGACTRASAQPWPVITLPGRPACHPCAVGKRTARASKWPFPWAMTKEGPPYVQALSCLALPLAAGQWLPRPQGRASSIPGTQAGPLCSCPRSLSFSSWTSGFICGGSVPWLGSNPGRSAESTEAQPLPPPPPREPDFKTGFYKEPPSTLPAHLPTPWGGPQTASLSSRKCWGPRGCHLGTGSRLAWPSVLQSQGFPGPGTLGAEEGHPESLPPSEPFLPCTSSQPRALQSPRV